MKKADLVEALTEVPDDAEVYLLQEVLTDEGFDTVSCIAVRVIKRESTPQRVVIRGW